MPGVFSRLGVAAVCLLCTVVGCSADNETPGGNFGRRDASVDSRALLPEGGTASDVPAVMSRDIQAIEIASPVEDDVVALDGNGVYDDVEDPSDGCPYGDGGACTTLASGCVTTEILNDGVDNNCNGQIDEGASCLPGDVQRCFRGQPGRRNVGVCADGMQTCQGAGEFGAWGPCVGGVSPSTEVCDDADNDCDGCPDDGLCCRADGSCPSADDPRVPEGRPFAQYTLNGNVFYPGRARAWRWHVEGGPCDQMLFATSRVVSYTLVGSTTDPRDTGASILALTPTLSGDYTVTLTITREDGSTIECTFVVKIRAPGMRVELCWDRTGVTDIDLWVHRPRNTADWTSTGTAVPTTATCAYNNCRNATSPALGWGYAATPGGACREPAGGNCNNPRLDLDNIATVGAPENINIDNPNPGDDYRVAVNYYSGTGAVQPMVNIYCGGALRGTFGGANVAGTLYGSAPITGFATPGQNLSGSLWRVVDVVMDSATDCTLHPLVSTGTTTSCVQNGNNRTFNGAAPACVRR